MHVVLGATGHIGSALSQRLLDAGEPVTVVTRNEKKAQDWEARGARAAVLDVRDGQGLRALLGPGVRLFLLVPPADPATNTVAEERGNLLSILAALQGSSVERVVAESTYGAEPAPASGDSGLLHEMERALEALQLPCSVMRGAYYMSNWDGALGAARDEGVVESFFPEDFVLPMVAPADIAALAARLMTAAAPELGLHPIEGPERYTPNDVAAAFGAALGKEVRVRVVPRNAWRERYQALGFSREAAESYAKMTALALDGTAGPQSNPHRGATTLRSYIEALVRNG